MLLKGTDLGEDSSVTESDGLPAPRPPSSSNRSPARAGRRTFHTNRAEPALPRRRRRMSARQRPTGASRGRCRDTTGTPALRRRASATRTGDRRSCRRTRTAACASLPSKDHSRRPAAETGRESVTSPRPVRRPPPIDDEDEEMWRGVRLSADTAQQSDYTAGDAAERPSPPRDRR